jgi:hypothetical protein
MAMLLLLLLLLSIHDFSVVVMSIVFSFGCSKVAVGVVVLDSLDLSFVWFCFALLCLACFLCAT